LRLLMPVLARLCGEGGQSRTGGWITWVSPPHQPYARVGSMGHRSCSRPGRARRCCHGMGNGPGFAIRSLQRGARLGQSTRCPGAAPAATGRRAITLPGRLVQADRSGAPRHRRPCCGSRCWAATRACRYASSRAAEAVRAP
jgi:hypothetical protein